MSTKSKEKLAAQYNSIIKDYSAESKFFNQKSAKVFWEFINFPLDRKKVLDMGCGDGHDLQKLMKERAIGYGVDTSSEQVSIAKRTVPNATIKKSDMAKTPFSNNFFDIVVSKYAIQTSKDVQKIFNEAHRVLKPKGILVFMAVHPFRQFFERKKKNQNYFRQTIVKSVLFKGKVTVEEPTHTFNEYLSEDFLKKFDVLRFFEKDDFLSAEQIDNHTYPSYFVIQARKR